MGKVRKLYKRVKTRRKQISKSRRVKKGGCGQKRKSMKGGKYLYKSRAIKDMIK